MYTDETRVGDERRLVLVEDLTRTQIVQYAGASGDYNPLHTDDLYTREVAGYPGVFAHGMLTMGMTGRVLTDWAEVTHLLRFGVRFVKQVWPGDTLIATARVTELREEAGEPVAELSVVTTNQHDETVVTGSATVRLHHR